MRDLLIKNKVKVVIIRETKGMIIDPYLNGRRKMVKGKTNQFRKIGIYAVICISAVLSGILLIPVALIVLFIIFIWKITDKIIRSLERKE